MNKRVLLVDDEPEVLEGYQRMLSRQFEIETALGGEAGLTSIRDRGPFGVVIADLRMPGMDGVQFLSRVRQAAPNTVRLVLSGDADLQTAVDAVNQGYIFRFLIKPCEEKVLTDAITRALLQHDQRREDRIPIRLPVQLCRSAGSEKFEPAYTLDISNSGVRLGDLQEPVQVGEVLEIHCGGRKARFRVVWIGSPGTPAQGQAGLEGLAPDANIWSLDLPRQTENEPPPREIALARTVQSKLLPQGGRLQTLDYKGYCVQARVVGGDYYDFLDRGAGEVGFVMADVAGKGIAAALLMANLQGSLRSYHRAASQDLAQWLAAVNGHFYKHTESHRYATLFFGCYSDARRILRYVNCGHNPPLLLRNTGAVERLQATATVVGLFREWECSVAETPLAPGDVLCIYTDGVTETTGRNGGEFGEARLLKTLRESRDLEPAAMLQNVEQAVKQFRSGEQGDDLTLVIARAR